MGLYPSHLISQAAFIFLQQNCFVMKEPEKILINIIEGKTGVIVCPSKSMEGKNLGHQIDTFDFIVRLNNGYDLVPEQRSDFGTRTDLVYHYLGLQSENQRDYDVQKMKAVGTKMILIPPRPEKEHFKVFLERNIDVQIPFLKIGNVLKKQLWSEIRCLPFCGIWSVFHLLKYPVKRLHVLGMNFFNTGHCGGYDTRSEAEQIAYAVNSQFDNRGIKKQHHIPPQKELLRKLYKTDNRLKLDEVTKNAISVK